MHKAQRIAPMLLLPLALLLAACGVVDSTTASDQIAAKASEEAPTLPPTVVPPSATYTQTPTFTQTSTPTKTPTPTPIPPMLSVSENTHCRTGPGMSYDSLGVLLAGERVEILARSTLDEYWSIANPSDPEQTCWISGAYANLEGEMETLIQLTPAPSPTPAVGFDMAFHSLEKCGGSTYAIFQVRNVGSEMLKSGWVEVIDFGTKKRLYGPAQERFPFAQHVRPVCPPGHGNELYPGTLQYIHTPLSTVPHGHNVRATFTLCTLDHQGGVCTTEFLVFKLP